MVIPNFAKTPKYGLPYLRNSDFAKDIGTHSKAIAETFETLISSGTFKGDPGARGLPGMNAVAADTAVGAYLGDPESRSRAALEAWWEEQDTSPGTWVSVMDHGAKADGTTDDLNAFTAAIAAAQATAGGRVFVPAGTYRVRSAIVLPSHTTLQGAGMGNTKIKLSNTAAQDTWVITNAGRPTRTGAKFITVRDMDLDWNRTGRTVPDWTESPKTGGSRGSALCFSKVEYAWIERVRAHNSRLHAFDITSEGRVGNDPYDYLEYNYPGDMAIDDSPGPSRFVWMLDCEATDFGDDGITTHHSEWLWIRNCYSHHPWNRDNCNGIEIDDGSRLVFLENNLTFGCYAGIEIKAHASSPAAQRITITGHMSFKDCRSYNWRHIGHHSATDPNSKSAVSIVASNLVAMYPTNEYGFQGEATPRALAISAFRDVSINGFMGVGLGGYPGGAAVTIQYKAQFVTIEGITLRGFTGMDHDIYLFGGDNRPDRCNISGVTIAQSANNGIGLGSDISRCNISGVQLQGRAIAGTYGIKTSASGNNLYGFQVTSYENAMDVAGTKSNERAYFRGGAA